MLEIQLQWQEEQRLLRLSSKARYRIGRDPGCDVVIPQDWQGCSRYQAELVSDATGWCIVDGVNGRASANGTFWQDGTPVQERSRIEDLALLVFVIGQDPQNLIRIQVSGLPIDDHAQHPTPSPGDELDARDHPTPLRSQRQASITIGRSPDSTIVLNDPTVSRRHAVLRVETHGAAVLEDCSSNGLFVDGKKAGRLTRIVPGAQLHIGRGRFCWDGSELRPVGDQVRFGIEVRDLQLPNRLRSMSLSIPGGQLVAFVGGSGAGKSSLLTTLAGQNSGYGGHIQIGGEDLRSSIHALRPLMGFVPQDDIVHRDLTVMEVLMCAARLRIPDQDERVPAVQRVLELLELSHRQDALVRDLSGGQRKRVNIGVELVSDPRLLFLDEPTSGLDPGLDRRMMRLLRELANRGHTVLVVTHATANVTLCDQLIFMGRGGRLCYSGTPQGCLQNYGAGNDFAEVYDRLSLSDAELEAETRSFQQNQRLEDLAFGSHAKTFRQLQPSSGRSVRQFVSQLRTVFLREILLIWRDRISLLFNLLTAPVAVFLLGVAIQNREVFLLPEEGPSPELLPLAIKVVFVICCACIWTGISTHIGSVARERAIYEREKSFNLQPLAYIVAKSFSIALLAVPQAVLIALTCSVLFEFPELEELGSPLLGYCVGAAFTILASGSLALFLSTLVKDQRQAGSSSPLLLMPQIILSGVLFEIGGLVALYPVVASRWSVKLFGAFSFFESIHFDSPGSPLPAIDVSPYLSTWSNVNECLFFLLIQFVGFVFGSYVVLSRRRAL